MSDPADPIAELAGIAADLAGAAPRTPAEHATVASLRARLARLVELLMARGVLHAGDARLLALVGASAARPRVHLAVARDKHAVASPPIDCSAHLHLCHARCCSFQVTLSPDDVREGRLRWDLADPYLLARGGDGYCTHLRGDGGGCECYADRPAPCRDYDCRDDRRVWLDYAARIPAPMPDGVTPRRLDAG